MSQLQQVLAPMDDKKQKEMQNQTPLSKSRVGEEVGSDRSATSQSSLESSSLGSSAEQLINLANLRRATTSDQLDQRAFLDSAKQVVPAETGLIKEFANAEPQSVDLAGARDAAAAEVPPGHDGADLPGLDDADAARLAHNKYMQFYRSLWGGIP
jgi:hypothetical protein